MFVSLFDVSIVGHLGCHWVSLLVVLEDGIFDTTTKGKFGYMLVFLRAEVHNPEG